MIDLAISFLLVIIIPAALFQPTAQRLVAGVVFSAVIITHEFAFSHLDGLAYYASDALLLLLVMVITSGISPTPKMVVTLQKVCIIGVVANAIGWLLWFFYISSIYYNMAFIVIYGYAFFTLIRKDRCDVGGYSLDNWRACIRFIDSPLYKNMLDNKKKI